MGTFSWESPARQWVIFFASEFFSYEEVEWLRCLSFDPHSDDDRALEVNKDHTSTFIPTDPGEVLPSHSRASFNNPADPKITSNQ